MIAGCLVLLLMVGLVTLVVLRDEGPLAQRSKVDWSALPPVPAPEPAPVPGPAQADVLAGLGAIDPCALSRRLANRLRPGSEPYEVPLGALECVTDGQQVKVRVQVAARVGYDLASSRRVDLGGRAAWAEDDARDVSPDCELTVPTGPDLALDVVVASNEGAGPRSDPCGPVVAPLAAVLADLGAGGPEARRLLLDSPRPMTCELVALAGLPGNWSTDRDVCTLEPSAATSPPGSSGGSPGASPSEARGHDDTGVRLERYTADFDEDAKLVDLPGGAGRKAQRLSDDDGLGCGLRWYTPWKQVGYDDSDDGRAPDVDPLTLLVQADTCEEVDAIATQLVTRGEAWRPRDVVPSLVSLTYATGAPDLLGQGACALLPGQAEFRCVPATVQDVPRDPVQLIRRGEADPALLCGAALRAIESLRTDLLAVTIDQPDPRDTSRLRRECLLLGPDTDARIYLEVTRDKALITDDLEEVAGHPGDTFGLGGSFQVWTVARAEPEDRGMLEVRISGGADKVPGASDDVLVETLVRGLLGEAKRR